jgi:hypothetical protein
MNTGERRAWMQETDKKKGRQNVRAKGKVRKNRRQRGAKMKMTNCGREEGEIPEE